MNYPPGMTRRDWEYVDGKDHHKLCTQHDDYVHECNHPTAWEIHPTLESRYGWVMSKGNPTTEVKIEYCPWCGEDLGPTDCICDEILAGLKEAAQERKETP